MIGIAIANSLGLNKISSPSLDPDAQAFITAAGITNSTQQSAINTLVLNLKSYSLWTKMKAIYPFVGGTATTHKYNLKDPRDLDAAFRILFNGGWTHSANGIQGNGTNGYINTFFDPLTQYSSDLFSAHISSYSRTNNTAGYYLDFSTNASGTLYALTFLSGDIYFYGGFNSGVPGIIPNTQGLFTVSMRNNSSLYVYRNSTTLGSDLNTYGSFFVSDLFTIGGSPSVGFYSPKQYAFATIGTGLTSTDTSNLYSAVQAFQTTLGRQV